MPVIGYAADFNLLLSTETPSVGGTFTATVAVSSSGEPMNAASGIVSFPSDQLEVVSVSKTNSIMNLWVAEPTFSNADGTITFEGVVLNPGFSGTKGTVIVATLRAKRAGPATLRFLSGSILANDGAGTDILKNLGTAALTIQNGSTGGAVSTIPTTGVDGSLITSTTHPDQTKWYANNAPEFSWQLPAGTLEVRTLIGQSSSGIPTVRYAPAISSKKVDELPDGTYYFALQIKTAAGWGEISRYRVNIDTTPPTPFSITFPHGATTWEPQPVILFNTTDDVSSVARYDVKLGGGGLERVAPPATSNPYPLPPQDPGTHTVTVTATDEAGNTQTASENFTIEAIDAPVITYYQEEIEVGDIVKIRGTSYPNSEIIVYVRDGDNLISEEYTKSNTLGDWAVVVTKRLDPGMYTFTAQVKDGRGAQSAETSPLTIDVRSRFINDLTQLVLNYLSAALLVIVSVALLTAGGVYVWYRSIGLIRHLRRESQDLEKAVNESFGQLRTDLRKHATRLKKAKNKRKLTKEEMAFLEQFEDQVIEAKDTLTKEIRDLAHE